MSNKVDYTKIKYVEAYCSAETLRETISAHGVAVIPSVFNSNECAEAKTLANNFLASTFEQPGDNVCMENAARWRNISRNFYAKHGGLIQHFGIGQSDFAWYARSKPQVIDIFKTLWNVKHTRDLVVSFDGANVTPPPERTGLGWQSADKMWLHTDQSERKKTICSVQGMVNLVDVDEGDATLLVIRGSNNLHAAFFAHFGLSAKGDWQILTQEHVDWFLAQEYAPGKRCELMAVKARAGDMIFWDSRTIHMGLAPSRGRAHADRWRYVVYVAMFPRCTLTAVQLRKRILYVNDGRTTNHWGTKLFAATPHTYGAPLCELRRKSKAEEREENKFNWMLIKARGGVPNSRMNRLSETARALV